jgi:hypothetical protein
VERLERSRKRDGIFNRPPGSAVQGETDFIAEDLLYCLDAGDDLCETTLRECEGLCTLLERFTRLGVALVSA